MQTRTAGEQCHPEQGDGYESQKIHSHVVGFGCLRMPWEPTPGPMMSPSN
jgi:hypothetical protein